MEKIFICLEKEVFQGNVLDITYDNMNIIYNSNKYYDRSVELDYVEQEDGRQETGVYDSCVLFFSFNRLKSKSKKELVIRDIYDRMSKGGYLYIWDVSEDKENYEIVALLPDRTLSKFNINCYNLIPTNKLEEVISIVQRYFSIELKVSSNKAYKLVCRRKDVIA